MIGDNKPTRLRRPLWRLVLSVGSAGIVLAWLAVGRPQIFAGLLAPLPVRTAATAVAAPPATATPLPTPTPTPAAVIYHVGETQHLDNIWVTPALMRHLGNHGYPVNAGDEILSISVTIENRSDQKYTVSLGHFVVQDSNGVQDPHLAYDPSRQRLREVTLVPTGHISGTITFEVPAYDAHLQLIYSPDIINPNKKKYWLLTPRAMRRP